MKKNLKQAINAIEKAIKALDECQKDTRTKNFEGKIYELQKVKEALQIRLNQGIKVNVIYQ